MKYIFNNWLELFGVFTGILYIILEIKQNPLMWIVGFISSLVYVFVFYKSKFYADIGLNIYYLSISIYGFVSWSFFNVKKNRDDKIQTNILIYANISKLLTLKIFLISVVLYSTLVFALKNYTDSPIPFCNSLSVTLSIIATWMVARKYIEHWFVWIFVNLFSIFQYSYQSLFPTAFLFFIYTILSIVGYIKWKKNGMCYTN